MSGGITLDTGALIALERRRDRTLRLIRAAHARGRLVTVPVVVVAEWWRGRTDLREAVVSTLLIESMTISLARSAGEAVADIPDATLVDAIVMASAARRGDAVLTSDVEDLTRLQRRFPDVRILAV